MQNLSSGDLCPLRDMYGTIRSALDEWKAARALLATTIQSYRAASTTLRTISAFHIHQPPERALVEELFLTINSELGSLAAEEGALYNARMSLAAMRNGSSTLVRVNALPPEILSSIFALSKAYCVHGDKRCFQNFAGVCAYWRRIAIHTADLWTHVDISPGASFNLTRLLLERTRNAPIHLHLFKPDLQMPRNPTSEHETITALKPHIHRVCDLEMKSHCSFDNSLIAVLNLWLTSGSPNLARSLLVLRPLARTLLSYGGSSENAKILNQSGNAREMLRSLNGLHLQNIRFDWDSSLYRGLVVLQLDSYCTKISISTPQLADILAANPALHTLRLSALRVTRQENWSYPSPIVLSYLRFLNLTSLDQDSLQLMLPLIGLPTPPTELNIAFPSPILMSQTLESFLARSGATRLYWHNFVESRIAGRVLALMSPPRLRDLVLRNFYIFGGLPAAEANGVVPRPSVILLHCTVTVEGLKALVANYGVQDLRLERCESGEGSKRLETMRISLLEAYPGLKCIISNTDSASWWVYGDSDIYNKHG